MSGSETALYRQGVKRLFAAASINVLASVATALAGVLTTALMARALPVSQFGRVLLMLTAVNAFAIFEGLRPVIIHRVATGMGAPSELFRSAAHINSLMAAVTLSCLLGLALSGITPVISPATNLVLALTVIAFFYAMQYWTFLDAEADTTFTGITRAGCWILVYAAFSLLSIAQIEITGYAIALLLMYVLLAMLFRRRFSAMKLQIKYRSSESDGRGMDLLRPALNNILFNVSAVTINVADRTIIGTVLGAQSAGLYAGPSELALRAVGLVRAGMQVVLPWAVRLSEGNQRRLWLASISIMLLAAGSGCALLILERNAVAALLLGETFRSMGDLLGIFGIGVLLSTLGYACIAQLNARGDFTTQRRLYISAASILVGGATWGATHGSLTFVALAFLISRSVDLVLLTLILREYPRRDRSKIVVLIAMIGLALAMSWLKLELATSAVLAMAYGFAYVSWRKSRL